MAGRQSYSKSEVAGKGPVRWGCSTVGAAQAPGCNGTSVQRQGQQGWSRLSS